MKTVWVVLMAVVLATALAVSASRAGPVALASAVMDRCQTALQGSATYQCQPVTRVVANRLEADDFGALEAAGQADVGGDFGVVEAAGQGDVGGDSIDPEVKVAKALHFLAELMEAAAQLLDHFTYGIEAGTPTAIAWVDELFDVSF